MEIYSVSLWHDSDNSDINVQPCSVEGMGDKYLLTACIGGWFNAHHPHPLPSLLSIKTHSPQCSTKQEVLWKMNSHAAVHNGVRAWTELWMIRGQVPPPKLLLSVCPVISSLTSHPTICSRFAALNVSLTSCTLFPLSPHPQCSTLIPITV